MGESKHFFSWTEECNKLGREQNQRLLITLWLCASLRISVGGFRLLLATPAHSHSLTFIYLGIKTQETGPNSLFYSLVFIRLDAHGLIRFLPGYFSTALVSIKPSQAVSGFRAFEAGSLTLHRSFIVNRGGQMTLGLKKDGKVFVASQKRSQNGLRLHFNFHLGNAWNHDSLQ